MRTAAVGSYPKISDDPGVPNWRNALNRFEAGRLTPIELEEVHRQTLRRIIAEQEEAGIDLITDGLLRWEDPVTPLMRDVAGLAPGAMVRLFNNNNYYRRPRITGRMRFLGSSLAEEYRQAAQLARRPVKAVLPGPYTFATLCEDETYGGSEQLLADAADILRLEAEALVAAGAPVVQFDEPGLLWAPEAERPRALQAVARAVAGLRTETVVAVYFRDPSPLLDGLAELPCESVHLDMVEGPGLWERLAQDGFPKRVVLGLLNGRDIRLETLAEVGPKVERVAARLGWERVDLAPSTGLEFLPHTHARLKLRRLVEIARGLRGESA